MNTSKEQLLRIFSWVGVVLMIVAAFIAPDNYTLETFGVAVILAHAYNKIGYRTAITVMAILFASIYGIKSEFIDMGYWALITFLLL